MVLALRISIKPSDKLEKAVEKNYDTSDKVGWHVCTKHEVKVIERMKKLAVPLL